jgi:hypothetical protein
VSQQLAPPFPFETRTNLELIHCSSPLLAMGSYLSAIPVLSFLSSSSGMGARLVTPLLSAALHRVSGATAESNPQKAIVLLTAFYLPSVYIVSAVMSVTGQIIGNKNGYHNKGLLPLQLLLNLQSNNSHEEPRHNKRNLSGLPHRMVATHEALYDIFPGR